MMNIPESEVIYLDGEMETRGDRRNSKSSIGDDCEGICSAAIVQRILIGARALATVVNLFARLVHHEHLSALGHEMRRTTESNSLSGAEATRLLAMATALIQTTESTNTELCCMKEHVNDAAEAIGELLTVIDLLSETAVSAAKVIKKSSEPSGAAISLLDATEEVFRADRG